MTLVVSLSCYSQFCGNTWWFWQFLLLYSQSVLSHLVVLVVFWLYKQTRKHGGFCLFSGFIPNVSVVQHAVCLGGFLIVNPWSLWSYMVHLFVFWLYTHGLCALYGRTWWPWLFSGCHGERWCSYGVYSYSSYHQLEISKPDLYNTYLPTGIIYSTT